VCPARATGSAEQNFATVAGGVTRGAGRPRSATAGTGSGSATQCRGSRATSAARSADPTASSCQPHPHQDRVRPATPVLSASPSAVLVMPATLAAPPQVTSGFPPIDQQTKGVVKPACRPRVLS